MSCGCCRFRRCCCCCTVETGSVIIATLGWVYTLVSLFGFLGHYQLKKTEWEVEHGNFFISLVETVQQQSLGVRIGYAIVDLIICLLLLWGIYKKDHRFVIPYLVMQCIKCVAVSIFTILFFAACFILKAPFLVIAILGFISCFISSLFFWYFWFCVWNLYMDLSEAGPHATVYYSSTSGPGKQLV